MTGHENATNDGAALREWACQFPGCNWAIVTGEGVFVLRLFLIDLFSTALITPCEES
ncbi:MAG: hypothetical protein H5U08_02845 [Thermogutta sp.]|nr:hypothetical protein [Thermogutta sp.]